MYISVKRDHFKEIFIVKVLVLIQTKIFKLYECKRKGKEFCVYNYMHKMS